MKIHGATGKAYGMGVDKTGRALISAKVGPRDYYVSRDDGLTFTVTSIIPTGTASANDYIFYLKNLSTEKRLFVKELHLGNSAESYLELWEVTGTPVGGTAIIPKNLNLTSNKTANALAYGTTPITSGLTKIDDMIIPIRVDNATEVTHDFLGSLILGTNNAIAVRIINGTAGQIEVSLLIHFEDV